MAHPVRGRTSASADVQNGRWLHPDPTTVAPPSDLVEALARPSDDEIAVLDAWWRANNYLTIGQIYLQDNPLLRRAADVRAHQAATARPLGHQPGPVVRLRPRLPADPAHRSGDDLPGRSRSRRPGAGRGGLAGGHLHRDLSRRHPGRRAGMQAAVPAVLLARRHPEPRLGDRRRVRSTRAVSWATSWCTPSAP